MNILFAVFAIAFLTLSSAARTVIELGSVEDNAAETMELKRKVRVPESAAGMSAYVDVRLVCTRAEVLLDGVRAGAIDYPGGEVEVTKLVKPGSEQTIELKVSAYPRNEKTLDFNAPDRATAAKSTVENRGAWGAKLEFRGRDWCLRRTLVACDTARKRIAFRPVYEKGREPDGAAKLRVRVTGCGVDKTFEGAAKGFVAEFSEAKTWDLDTPENVYTAAVSVVAGQQAHDNKRGQQAHDNKIDEMEAFEFGFREVRVKGKDILLNGTPVHLRMVNATPLTSRKFKRESGTIGEWIGKWEKLGFNGFIADNYNWRPGVTRDPEEFLSECDRRGLAFSFTLPSLSEFTERELREKEEKREELRAFQEYVIRRWGNHPSILLYGMDHNQLGYHGDMNPLRMNGDYDIVKEKGERCYLDSKRPVAELVEKTARELDPTRPVYHHESGTFGAFHTCNIYLDWAPRQERSDWLEEWSKNGVKPMFFVEWGAPHISSWSSYRGPLFIWRNHVYQNILASEYASAYIGDAAYDASPICHEVLKREESFWNRHERANWGWYNLKLKDWDNCYSSIQKRFLDDNWRSHRAWGISAIVPWDQGHAFREDGVTLTPMGEAFARWNGRDCSFIGGEAPFTDKRHLFRAGDKIVKTLVMLNDRRRAEKVRWEARLADGKGREVAKREGGAEIAAGARQDARIEFALPENAEGRYRLKAKFVHSDGSVERDEFSIDIVKRIEPKLDGARFFLYDPKGTTAAELKRLGIPFDLIGGAAGGGMRGLAGAAGGGDLPDGAKVIIGREALTPEIYREFVQPLRERHADVLIFEQSAKTLAALGFRVQTIGLREAFPIGGDWSWGRIKPEMLRDWAGEATLVGAYLENLPAKETEYPRTDWAGFSNTRVWRCRNRGSVASVVPEIPTLGDWRGIVRGGFALEYAPVIEQRWRDSSVVWCQLDVSGRSERDPAAEELVKRLCEYTARKVYAGHGASAIGFKAFFELRDRGVRFNQDEKAPLASRIVVSSGCGKKPAEVDGIVEKGGYVVALGLSAEEVSEWSPVKLAMAATNECFYSRIERFEGPLRGLSNADLAWHGSMAFDAFLDSDERSNAALMVVPYGKGAFVFWQVPPWKIDVENRPYLKASRKHADHMLMRILSNCDFSFEEKNIRYGDVPAAEDDPYRYYRW